MRYKSQIFPLTYTSRAFFVVLHQLSFTKNVLTPRKGQKKNPLALNDSNPLSLSLSSENTKALIRVVLSSFQKSA